MKTQKEQWKPIAECNGEYHISDHGQVKSYKGGKERILKPALRGAPHSRYWAVRIKTNEKWKMYNIHRLVALAFLSNPYNKPQVNHRDGNKLNNRADNLEWVTSKENTQHAWDTGLFHKSKMSAVGKANSKPVIDIVTGNKYDSLKLACQDIVEPYSRHCLRIFYKSKLQRFFFVN